MIRFDAAYYDGRSSGAAPVEVWVADDGTVRVRGEDVAVDCPLSELRVSDRLGDTPRFLRFADGAQCETADNDAVDTALAAAGRGGTARAVHRLERSLRWALLALAITGAGGWALVEYGIPAGARMVAERIPPEVERGMGREGMARLDRVLFEPSGLERPAARRVAAVFDRVVAAAAPRVPATLALRASPRIGANAFALPGGVVVVTDELVDLLDGDGQLAAVIAHELGHLERRHVLRQLLQGSATAVLVAATLGDLSSVTGLAGALPTLLVRQRYSRAFELEADHYAARVLAALDEPPARLVEALERLGAGRDDEPGGLGYLSSHPSTRAREEALASPR